MICACAIAHAATSPLSGQIEGALKSANPDYKGGGNFRMRDGKLTAISLMRAPGLRNLSPLKKFPISTVGSVVLYNSRNVHDLSPLESCRLSSLNIERCIGITNLAPLKGMPLRFLRMYACPGIASLEPLKGAPLRDLDLGLNPNIDNLSPLQDMKLHDLRFDNCPHIKDISVIRGMPLKFLSLFGCPGIQDYSPLEGLKLETLYFSPHLLSDREIAIVRNMKSLRKIGTSWNDYRKEMSPGDFWKKYDAGDYRKAR